jgi:hypothetical protein
MDAVTTAIVAVLGAAALGVGLILVAVEALTTPPDEDTEEK